ncbi:hypothetical protein, partial [Streptomyces echinatus]|uniref:hypothetical protein n=1 Tax=Streptomyces echinatus TaxID=67293 RepID=UPI001C867628
MGRGQYGRQAHRIGADDALHRPRADARSVLQAISFGESAVADECGSDRGEGHEVFGFAFV